MDLDVEVYFASRSVRLLLPGVAESLRTTGNGGETIAHFMRESHQAGAKFFVCTSAKRAFLETDAALIPEVDGYAGAGSFIARAADTTWATLVF